MSGAFAAWPRRAPLWAAALGWAGLAGALIYFSCLRGALDKVQTWGYVYWWLDYGDGLVRRGLAGHLFQMAFGSGLDRDSVVEPVLAVHLGALALLGAAMAVLFGSTLARLRGQDALIFAGLGLWLFASQVWPTVTFNTGYLDVYVLLLAVAAAVMLDRGWIVPAGLVMVAGPFVHEYFVFLAPAILASTWRDPLVTAQPEGELLPLDAEAQYRGPSRVAQAVLLGLTATAAVVVTRLSSYAASMAQLQSAPVLPDQRETLMVTTLGQGAGWAFRRMVGLILDHLSWTVQNGAFFLLPAAVLCGGILWWRGRAWPVRWLQVACALFPALALLLAWDLSRLLVMTNLTAGLVFLMTAAKRLPGPGEG